MAEYLYSTTEGKKTRLNFLLNSLTRQKTTVFISIILLAAVSLVYYFLQEKDFRAAAFIRFDENASIYLSDNQTLKIDEEADYITSDDFLKKTAVDIVSSGNAEQSVNLFLGEKTEIPAGDSSALVNSVFEKLQESTSVEQNRNSIITYVEAPSAEGAMTAAKQLAESFTNYISEKFDKSSRVTSFIDEKITARKTDLNTNQQELNDYKETNRTVILAGRYSDLIKNISVLEAELEKKEIERQLSQILLNGYRKTLSKIDSEIAESVMNIEDQYINQVKGKISDLKAEKPGAPAKANANFENRLSSLKNDLRTAVKDYVDDLIGSKRFRKSESEIIHQFAYNVQLLQVNESASEKSKANIYDQLTNYENQFGRIPSRSAELANLTRRASFDQQVLTKLQTLENDNNWLEFVSANNFAGLDYDVSLIGQTGYGIFSLLLIGLGAGLIIGLIIAAGLNMFFSYINSPKDIDSFGLKLIAIIPKLKTKDFADKKTDEDKNLSNSLLFSDENYLLAEESFKRLEDYLKNAFLDKSVKSLIVTSSVKDEGKSTIAANLAITIANRGSQVLLVDANMRDPRLAEIFNVESSSSLPHYLFKKKELNEIIIPTHVNNLKLVTSIEFNQNLSLVLSSKRMINFMQLVNSEYDYVIYDTPSVSEATDALLISDNVDETILITSDEKTSFDDLKKAIKQFDANEISIGGVVLNAYNMQKLSPEYEEYYGFSHLLKESKKKKTSGSEKIDLSEEIPFDLKDDDQKSKK